MAELIQVPWCPDCPDTVPEPNRSLEKAKKSSSAILLPANYSGKGGLTTIRSLPEAMKPAPYSKSAWTHILVLISYLLDGFTSSLLDVRQGARLSTWKFLALSRNFTILSLKEMAEIR